jgi:GDP-L-fucose synthase
MPALIRKTHEAKNAGDGSITIWGTGTPRREFLHVDDLADACVFLMMTYSGDSHVNIGFGDDVTIRELAEAVKAAVGFNGEIVCDTSKPDGTPRKLMDSGLLAELGWQARTPLNAGIASVYRWFIENDSRA